MKKILLPQLFAFMILLSSNLHAQKFLMWTKAQWTWLPFRLIIKTPLKIARIIYSRPLLKDVVLTWRQTGKFGELGNEAAEITLYKDMNLGQTKIKADILYTPFRKRFLHDYY
jgi:hypothetical protein